jgi:hypothetical protein
MGIILDPRFKDQLFLKWGLNSEEIHAIMTEFRAIFNE